MTASTDIFLQNADYAALPPEGKMHIWKQMSLMGIDRMQRKIEVFSAEEIQQYANNSGNPVIFLDCLGISLTERLKKLTAS